MKCGTQDWLRGFGLLFFVQTVLSMVIPNSTHLELLLEKYMNKDDEWWVSKQRGKRAITEGDMHLILDLHNNLRGQVYPQASNMEYMVWDTDLERSAEHWAHTCLWEHGPQHMLTQIGQNLGAHWGRDRPPTFHVQAWYDEVRDYSYPYPQECNPDCPFRCSGPVCTHYTQMVWATSSHIGCAINICYNMNVWGMIWTKAVYLVCNYSPPGNWWGHAPYKHGSPCSACPPSYGGGCRDNLCYKENGVDRRPAPELEETNYIEPEPRAQEPRSRPQPPIPSPNDNMERNEVVSTVQMCQQMDCETKLRDRCKETTCNRYECPPGCLSSPGKVIGTAYYDMKSSICRAAIHAGVIQNDSGGYLDVQPVDKRRQYSGSYQNGISSESLQNPSGGKAFRVFAVI
uniref:Cysteine-rich secretory protein LCCL domain containing 1b n=1 Tax=Oncorhynchus kisutch TaxID=8019 RepID=A0A8C7HLF5_ONCKI